MFESISKQYVCQPVSQDGREIKRGVSACSSGLNALNKGEGVRQSGAPTLQSNLNEAKKMLPENKIWQHLTNNGQVLT